MRGASMRQGVAMVRAVVGAARLARAGRAGRAPALLPVACAAVVLAGVAAGPAWGQRLSKIDGDGLVKQCTGRAPEGCDAYVSGVADAGELLGRSNPAPTGPDALRFCIPAEVTGTALRATVTAWAQGHAEDRRLPAAMLVVHAFRASYACKSGAPAGVGH